MKAIVQTKYGPPDALEVREIDTPEPRDGEVLVRIHAASVNPLDWHSVTGSPFLIRMAGFGLFKPKRLVPGIDMAGRVESVGPGVTDLKTGDEVFGSVFGTAWGAYAEYAAVPPDRLAHKPANVTFEHAAATPVAGITTLQAFRAAGGVQPGQRVLVNGAAGGCGTFAVQYARSCGAEVTGVCSTRGVDLVRSIGAAHVIDYTREDFTRAGPQFDIFLDTVGGRPVSHCRRVLKPTGVYATIAIGSKKSSLSALTSMLRIMVASRFGKQKAIMVMSQNNRADLLALKDLLAAGKMTPVIDQRFTGLAQVPDLLRHQGAGHARGKSVVTIVP